MILLIQITDSDFGPLELKRVNEVKPVPYSDIMVLNAFNDGLAPHTIKQFAMQSDAVILGGDPQLDYSDSNSKDKIEYLSGRLTPTFNALIKKDKQTLSLGLSSHLLSDYLGVSIINDSSQSENGVVELSNVDTSSDSILQSFDATFNVPVSHVASISELPEGAELLVSSDKCPIQMYQHGENITISQPHLVLKPSDFHKFYSDFESDQDDSNDNYRSIVSTFIQKYV